LWFIILQAPFGFHLYISYPKWFSGQIHLLTTSVHVRPLVACYRVTFTECWSATFSTKVWNRTHTHTQNASNKIIPYSKMDRFSFYMSTASNRMVSWNVMCSFKCFIFHSSNPSMPVPHQHVPDEHSDSSFSD
jgi:hypothetical protein